MPVVATIRRPIRSPIAALLVALALILTTVRPAAAQSTSDILETLRAGGHVIYFRHAATTWSGIDSIDWPRERQRLLSEQGIEDSRQIGVAFQAQNIPVGDVLASPFARCRDMAEIAFGRVEERFELLGLLSDDEGRAERAAYLEGLLTDAPADRSNRVIVAHRSNIQTVAGVSLEEGEAVIVRPGPDGFEILGTLMPADWTQG